MCGIGDDGNALGLAVNYVRRLFFAKYRPSSQQFEIGVETLLALNFQNQKLSHCH